MTTSETPAPIQTVRLDPDGLEAHIWHNTAKEGTYNVSFYDAESGQYFGTGTTYIATLERAVQVATKALSGE